MFLRWRSTSRSRWEPFVGFSEQPPRAFHVEGALFERFRIPFATARCKEVAAVDVQRRGDLLDRVRDGMNDVLTERRGVFRSQRFGAGRLERRTRLVPENIVLAPPRSPPTYCGCAASGSSTAPRQSSSSNRRYDAGLGRRAHFTSRPSETASRPRALCGSRRRPEHACKVSTWTGLRM